jgi:hypothetical protein
MENSAFNTFAPMQCAVENCKCCKHYIVSKEYPTHTLYKCEFGRPLRFPWKREDYVRPSRNADK